MTTTVPKRTLSVLMNALSSGVVPRRGLEYIAVGRKKETETFVSDLEDTAEGGGAFRFISGRFGNGKSFMIQMVRNYALDRGFVTMDADLSINRRLTGSKKEGLNTYMELIKTMAVKTRPDGGALELMLEIVADGIIEDLKASDMEIDQDSVFKKLTKMTESMSAMQHYRDFIKMITSYCIDHASEKDDIPSVRWFKGEYDSKNEVKRDLEISLLINDENWYDMIKLWAGFSRSVGYKGLVVFIDEGIVLYKLQSKQSRQNNYERLLTIFNDIMQGRSSYLSMYVCGTPEFIEDQNRGLYSYGALRSRLTTGRYENGYDNYLGPVINLRPLTNEELFVLLRTVKGLHEQRYDYTSEIDDQKMETYLRSVIANSVSPSLLTPREVTRDLISLLDTLHQNPGLRFDNLIHGRKVTPDADPADDIIEGLDI